MKEKQLEALARFLSEEAAHHKYGDLAVELNVHTGEIQFTDETERFIHNEMSVILMTFESFGLTPKKTLYYRFKKLLRIID
jgi:hypothetical protein